MTQIRFCQSPDGVRIAYTQGGRGPAMIEVATWLNHVEHDSKSPIWKARLAELTTNYTLRAMTVGAAVSPIKIPKAWRSTILLPTWRPSSKLQT
jgi:hypothetical protein